MTNKYHRTIHGIDGTTATVDVYAVLAAFNVTCPATQHAIKKLLAPGQRGHKDKAQDLAEARASIDRAIQMAGYEVASHVRPTRVTLEFVESASRKLKSHW